MTSLSTDAPAKINIHLAIGPRRKDGYHGLASVFQAISLADTVTVGLDTEPGIRLDCRVDCPPERNTMYRAAALWLEAAGSRAPSGVAIQATKRIPSGAGLGGGSSDAAAVLRLLAALFPAAVPPEALAGLAAEVGSDVPFFLGGPCAAVLGRGELVRPVEPRSDYALALIHPGFPIATADAYARLDEQRPAGPGDRELAAELDGVVGSYHKDEPGLWNFRNDFYPVLSGAYPGLERAMGVLRTAGASFSAMSGSGSVLFGVFENADSAARAAMSARAVGLSAWTAFPLARLPESV
ncbi:MAG: 4-(cytidine 5'-diphospho)-2-C-methyl-D-erythritol kinase [Spirochaetales bacterium]|nr:4-(cytidine 5'-diphospho)-2-C-methyl-D-erythritol kinase [Spirochaetales bacterium]